MGVWRAENKLQWFFKILTKHGGDAGGLTAGPGCSHTSSSHTGRSAGRTSHRGEWAACAGSSPTHWLLVRALWVTERKKNGGIMAVFHSLLSGRLLIIIDDGSAIDRHFISLILNPSGECKTLHLFYFFLQVLNNLLMILTYTNSF